MGAVKDRVNRALDRAEEMGRNDGCDGASWLFDGNTEEYTARICIQWDYEGDPRWWDHFGPAYEPLSGEWSDQVSLEDVINEIGLGDEELPDFVTDEIAHAYEQGFMDGWHTEAMRSANYIAGTEQQ